MRLFFCQAIDHEESHAMWAILSRVILSEPNHSVDGQDSRKSSTNSSQNTAKAKTVRAREMCLFSRCSKAIHFSFAHKKIAFFMQTTTFVTCYHVQNESDNQDEWITLEKNPGG